LSTTEISTGISFGLSDEQRALRDLAREFADREIRSVAADYDERSQHPADVIAKAHEVGLMNPHIPEELGGPGLSAFEQILIGEELAWGCSGIATSIVANILGSLPVLLAGSEEQKREWLPPLLAEPLLQLVHGLGPALVRAKGFIHLDGEPRRGFLERAGERTSLVLGEPWGADPPRTELVLIGEGLDAAALQPQLWACRRAR